MDGLSATASLIAVLQLTAKVIEYINDMKDAPRHCQLCAIEASNLQNLLINLRFRLEQRQEKDAWFTALRGLDINGGPLDQYKEAVKTLVAKVEIDGTRQEIKKRLSWTFSKGDVEDLMGRIERLKLLISIALEMDHL